MLLRFARSDCTADEEWIVTVKGLVELVTMLSKTSPSLETSMSIPNGMFGRLLGLLREVEIETLSPPILF